MRKAITITAGVILFLAFCPMLPVLAEGSGPTISSLNANPYVFNSSTGGTDIEYILNDITDGNVLLEIYDSTDTLVRSISAGTQSSGAYDIPWDGRDNNGVELTDGNYTVKLSVSVGSGGAYEFVLKWGSYGSGDGQFDIPIYVTANSDGNIYVTDFRNHRIQKFSSNGGFITKWGSYGSGDGQFKYPFGIAVDSGSNVYVVDYYNRRIQKFDSNGGFITKWGSYGSGDGQFKFPRGIAIDPGDNVYVVDYNDHRIQKFDSNGGFITKWGSYGSGDGQFKYPAGIAVDSGGNVYVVDHRNHRIQKFDSDGGFITKWGSYDSGNGQFKYPAGVAIDSGGNVYVAGYSNHRIQKFDSDGGFITKWGSYGSGDGQFKFPVSIVLDSGGNVYVAGYSNHRIQKFASAGIAISAETDVIVDSTPPTLTVPDDIIVEGNTVGGANVTLPPVTATDIVDPLPVVSCDQSSGFFPLGMTTVNCTATDAAGNSTSASFTVTVVDTTPPSIHITVSPDMLWPSNHKLVEVSATVNVSDICDPSPNVVLSSIVSSEPDNAKGNEDGNTVNDIQDANIGTEDYNFLLRAERAGSDAGRVYTITYAVTDVSGNVTIASAKVTVPHDQREEKISSITHF